MLEGRGGGGGNDSQCVINLLPHPFWAVLEVAGPFERINDTGKSASRDELLPSCLPVKKKVCQNIAFCLQTGHVSRLCCCLDSKLPLCCLENR